MQGIGYVFVILGVCYFLILGFEYHKVIEGQNWTPVKAKVEGSINGLPFTKFSEHRINALATIVNWSYIKYSYYIGQGFYEGEQELGPHLTMFDFMLTPLAQRVPVGSEIEVRFDPRNPKQSRIGLEVLKPVEMLAGSGVLFMIIGGLMIYVSNMMAAAHANDEELDQPLEYFDKKRKAL